MSVMSGKTHCKRIYVVNVRSVRKGMPFCNIRTQPKGPPPLFYSFATIVQIVKMQRVHLSYKMFNKLKFASVTTCVEYVSCACYHTLRCVLCHTCALWPSVFTDNKRWLANGYGRRKYEAKIKCVSDMCL